MDIKKVLTTALLATASVASFSQSAQALPVYQSGDLFLSFSALGSDNNYVVDIGPASQFTANTDTTVVAAGNVGADLVAIYENYGVPVSSIKWSIVGTPYNGGSVTTPTLFASAPRGNVGTPAVSWTAYGNSLSTITAGLIQTFASEYRLNGLSHGTAAPNNSAGVVQKASGFNSYTSFISSPTRPLDFDTWSNIEGNLTTGAAGSVLDLIEIAPVSGQQGVNLGSFRIENGYLIFVGSAVANPSAPVFPENILPVVNLAATPKAGTKFNAPAAAQTFTGTLTEANLDTFTYSVNGGAPVDLTPGLTPALPNAGSFTWSTSITLAPGLNTIVFTATDLSGNTRSVSRAVSYLKPITPDTLIPNDGSIALPKGAINEGFAYTLTAKPPAGKIVSQWFNNGNPILGQAGSTLTVTPEDGDLYTATFVDNFFPDVVGIYPGIFGDGDTALPTTLASFNLENGSATFKITTTGAFTGTVTLAGKSIAIKGQFDGLKHASVVTSGLSLDLTLDNTVPIYAKIGGTLSYNGGTPLTIESLRSTPYTGKVGSIAPLNGKRYSLALQRPVGDLTLGHGFASVAIGKTGLATVSGQLPDGTAFSATVPVVEKGSDKYRVPISRQLAKGNTGLLHGELEIDAATKTIESTANFGWLRAGVANPALPFASGILKSLDALGSQWILPTLPVNTSLLTSTGQIALFSLGIDTDNAFFALNPANAAALYFGYWPSTNQPGINALPKGTTFSFVASTGAFSGKTTRLSATNKAVSVAYKGLVLPEQVLIAPTPALSGVGYITTGSLSGKVQLGEQVVTP